MNISWLKNSKQGVLLNIGKSLKTRILILICSLAIVVPIVIISSFAALYYYLGVEEFFGERISRNINATVKVANLYLEEHINSIKIDALTLVNVLDKNSATILYKDQALNAFLDMTAYAMNLSEIILFKGNNEVMAFSNKLYTLFEPVPPEALAAANKGEIYVYRTNNDKVRALLRLDKVNNASANLGIYLLLGRFVEPEILEHLKNTRSYADAYVNLHKDLQLAQKKTKYILLLTAIVFLIIAFALTKKLANIIVRPINELVDATSHVTGGDFSFRVPERENYLETSILARAFNQMMAHIMKQRDEIIMASAEIDERRRFVETIVSELSVGVMVLNNEGVIELCNNAARKILDLNNVEEFNGGSRADFYQGKCYEEVFPEISDFIQNSEEKPGDFTDGNEIKRVPGLVDLINSAKLKNTYSKEIRRKWRTTNAIIKILAIYNKEKQLKSIIITINDITELETMQRLKAWSEVAKRVAHEIKNPLTPIQLAVERLQSKFLPQITQEPHLFSKYINTIMSHTDDILKLISDFVQFGRLSTPQIGKYDLCAIVKEMVFLQQTAYSEVEYSLVNYEEKTMVYCDLMQIRQVFTNLLKNATEAVLAKKKQNPGFIPKISIKKDKLVDKFNVEIESIAIIDNGGGMDDELIENIRLGKSAVSGKKGGTGLGLLIVKKILEEHGTTLQISNNKLLEGVEVVFALKKVEN